MSNIDEAILRTALDTITGERRKDYGSPEDNFACIAKMWEAYLRATRVQRTAGPVNPAAVHITVSTADVAVLNILQKVARLANTPNHTDSWVDIAGYAACGARVARCATPARPTTDGLANREVPVKGPAILRSPMPIQADFVVPLEWWEAAIAWAVATVPPHAKKDLDAFMQWVHANEPHRLDGTQLAALFANVRPTLKASDV